MPAPGAARPPACILVRHAHAEWPDYRGRDFDRPLTQRGLADARAAGFAIRAAGLAPRRVISSAALRTTQTARILQDILQLPDGAVELHETLYNADARTLLAALQATVVVAGCTLLVAHNPGISELAGLLAGTPAPVPFRPAQWQAFGATSPAGSPGD